VLYAHGRYCSESGSARKASFCPITQNATTGAETAPACAGGSCRLNVRPHRLQPPLKEAPRKSRLQLLDTVQVAHP
jgi:hypothetical protein